MSGGADVSGTVEVGLMSANPTIFAPGMQSRTRDDCVRRILKTEVVVVAGLDRDLAPLCLMTLRSADLTPMIDSDSVFANINVFASGESVHTLDFGFLLSFGPSVRPRFVEALTCCPDHLNFSLTVEPTRLRNGLTV